MQMNQLVAVSVAAVIAAVMPLPAAFFSNSTEELVFRVICVAAAALVVWRDDHQLFAGQDDPAQSPPGARGQDAAAAAGTASGNGDAAAADAAPAEYAGKIKILYASTTGNAKSLALALRKAVNTHTRKATATVVNLKDYDPEDLAEETGCVAVVLSTWTGGAPPRDGVFFEKYLLDTVLDFRRSKTMLSGLRFCVFGVGSSAYPEEVFCAASKRIYESLSQLGARPVAELAFGDDAQGDMDAVFAAWAQNEVLPNFQRAAPRAGGGGGGGGGGGAGESSAAAGGTGGDTTAAAGDKKPLSKREARLLRQKQNEARYGPSRAKVRRLERKAIKFAPAPLEEEDLVNDTFLSLPEQQEQAAEAARRKKLEKEQARQDKAAELAAEAGFDPRYQSEDEEEEGGGGGDEAESGMVDIEAIGGVLHAQKLDAEAQKNKPPREMVTGRQRQALTKEGYKIIGTHSAVKLCRWTKHQLRGRGGCYKHTCYGITSYQCMEATPSLACANKCTFCWRHHKNPVGTEWRWKMDPPRQIVAEAIRLHQAMINEYAGAPGVKPARLKEAFTVKHCALSLVGEPIMYPRINELVDELHKRRVSTFLVTNAQFPECISTLDPVTQLYVSIDAATKESLQAVDRPLFSDFWERFIASLKALRDKQQRTVYRLTLLKGENMDGLEQYARLIAMGQPDFVEIKAVTFCGKSDAADGLSHSNVPFHSEVLEFSTRLSNMVNELRVRDEKATGPSAALRRRLQGAAAAAAAAASPGAGAGAGARRVLAEGEEADEKAAEDEPRLEYGIACEHHHSNLVLLAQTKFRDAGATEGGWNTWIDYERFHELVAAGEPFTAMDYVAPTPRWATYGEAERGMDPDENRWYHNRTVRRAKAGQLSKEIMDEYLDNPADQKHAMGSGKAAPFVADEKQAEADGDSSAAAAAAAQTQQKNKKQ